MVVVILKQYIAFCRNSYGVKSYEFALPVCEHCDTTTSLSHDNQYYNTLLSFVSFVLVL